MKNLKDEIEEILADYEIMRTLTLQGTEQTYKGGVVEELVQALTSLIEQAQRDAVEGLKVRQISGFQRDELGRWYKRYPTGMVLVTDEMLLDALNVRQENIDLINEYLNQTKEDIKEKQ